MKKKSSFLLILITIIYSSCTNQKQEVTEKPINESPSQSYFTKFNDEEKRKELVYKVSAEGDTLAYNELWDIYTYSGHSNEFLKISLVMADNFNFPQAYFDTYHLLKTDVIDSSNVNTNRMANYYLLKAHELKDINSESPLKERFSNGIIPKSEEYWKNIHK